MLDLSGIGRIFAPDRVYFNKFKKFYNLRQSFIVFGKKAMQVVKNSHSLACLRCFSRILSFIPVLRAKSPAARYFPTGGFKNRQPSAFNDRTAADVANRFDHVFPNKIRGLKDCDINREGHLNFTSRRNRHKIRSR